MSPMRIDLNLPEAFLTAKPTAELRARISGDGFVSQVNIGGRAQWLEEASKDVECVESFALEPGENVVRVSCGDLLGQEMERALRIIADWDAPSLCFEKVKVVQGRYHIKGYCDDNIGLASVVLGGRSVFSGSAVLKKTRYAFDWNVEVNGTTLVELEDLAGNQWSVDLSEKVRRFLSRDENDAEFAALGQDIAPLVGNDRKAPSIRWANGSFEQRTFQPTFFVDVAVQDAGGISRLEVNGESWLNDNLKGLRSVALGRFIRPAEGSNSLTLVVWDQAGNRAESSFKVIKERPEYLWNKHRLRAAVMPVITPGRDWSGDAFRVLMEYHLQHKPEPYQPRFYLMPLERNVWEALLHQQELSLSALADPRARLDLPDYDDLDVLLKAQSFKDYGGYTVRSTVISATTGRILFSDDVYSESVGGDRERLIQGLVSKIESRFPYAEATLLAVDRGEIELELEKLSKIDLGHKFLVIDSAEDTLGEGRLKRWNDERVEVTVLDRKGKVCRARLEKQMAASQLENGDRLYTR